MTFYNHIAAILNCYSQGCAILHVFTVLVLQTIPVLALRGILVVLVQQKVSPDILINVAITRLHVHAVHLHILHFIPRAHLAKVKQLKLSPIMVDK